MGKEVWNMYNIAELDLEEMFETFLNRLGK